MKKGFDHIATLKLFDIAFQCMAFVLMITVIALSDLNIMALYMMGMAHFISSLAWLIIHHFNALPQKDSSRNLRRAIVIIFCILIVSLLAPGVFFLESFLLLIVGPIIGISYFITTIKEYNYFKTARKPYYLL